MKTLLLSPNAMKGSLTAFETASIMQSVIGREAPEITVVAAPVADGGDGTLDCLALALDADYRTSIVAGPVASFPVPAQWGNVPTTHTAIIEMAEASGLHLITPSRHDVMNASTRGTGELILKAMDEGCSAIILGLGGSTTNDGGAGCMRALGVRFLDARGDEIPEGGGALALLETIDVSHVDPRLAATHFTVLSDVRNPLCGTDGASRVFGPQKGATGDQTLLLDEALSRYASVIRKCLGRDVAHVPGSGAAGGFGAGLLAFCTTEFVSGIDYILDLIDYDRLLQSCDAVLTSEGMIDSQTGGGKGISGICRRARKAGKPVHAFVGRITGDAEEIKEQLGLASLTEISPPSLPVAESIARVKELLGEHVAAFASAYQSPDIH
jgi:glycerate kinase